jgi:hypothetical protein
MGDDDVKRLILARRARFVAAALASLTTAMCGGQTSGTSSSGDPEPCLSPRCEPPNCDPQPCLAQVPTDSGRDAPTDGPKDGSDDADDAGPLPCLSPPLDGG